MRQAGPWLALDVRDGVVALAEAVRQHRVTVIYHLAALLSATAEADPQRAWEVNVHGLLNVLEAARLHGCKVFHPSSISVFGPSAPRGLTPQETSQRPLTMYGVTKVAGELLCDYYHHHFGVDTRGLRYPGLLSYESPPGGGTTDYAVEIFYSALRKGHYNCYLASGTRLDMMYMPDATRAAIELMEAEAGQLRYRNAYNVTAMSFTPAELAAAIRRHLPDFTIEYAVDPVRQAIADSWPHRLDDSAARADWGWQPVYDLAATVADMLARLAQNMGLPAPPPAGGPYADTSA
jgi:nucleoside-diphosphate-sugar epimerase